jgi:hypothetical protein
MAQLTSLLVLLLLSVTLSHAAPLDYATFDWNNCQHWLITQDTQGSGRDFENAQRQAQKLNHAEWGDPNPDASEVPIWLPIQAFDLSRKGEESTYGVCKLDFPKSLTCAEHHGFPLSKMTFVLMASSGPNTRTYKCQKGCSGRNLKILYQLGYESDDGYDYKRALRRYERKCSSERTTR